MQSKTLPILRKEGGEVVICFFCLVCFLFKICIHCDLRIIKGCYCCGFEEALDLQILRFDNMGSQGLLPWNEEEGRRKN